jgi:hypothetical protein
MKHLLQSACVLLTLFVAMGQASAQSLTFVIRNEANGVVDYKLWSQNRNNVWPDARNVYGLNHRGDQRSTRISCVRGETICYGAWFRNNPKITWGAGVNGKARCASCCYVCNGSTTSVKTLTYSPRQNSFGR